MGYDVFIKNLPQPFNMKAFEAFLFSCHIRPESLTCDVENNKLFSIATFQTIDDAVEFYRTKNGSLNLDGNVLDLELHIAENNKPYAKDENVPGSNSHEILKKESSTKEKLVTIKAKDKQNFNKFFEMDEFVVESLIKNEINSRKHIDKNDQLGMIFDKSDRQSELIQLKFCDEFVNEAIYCAKQLINEEIDHLDFLRSQSSGITQYYKNFKIEDKLQNPAYNRMENFLKALDSSYFAKEYDNWRHLFNEKHKTNFLTGINEALEELWLKRKITGTCELGKSLISIFEDIELPFELLDYLKSTFQEFEYDYTSYLTKVLNNMPEEFDDLQHQTWKNFTSVIKRLTYLTPDSEATPQGIKEIVRFISAEPKVFHSVDGKSIFVTGFRYKISECLEKVENLITDEVALVKFFSFAAIVLDCNISGNKWHSKNLVFYAEKIIISKNVVVDLSGRNGGDVNDRAADSDGKKDGTDGIDGAAGKNSGNVVFYINEKPKNEEKLTIILNGGNGGKGQDGGHGTNGRNGAYVRREDFEKKIKDVEPEKFNDAESLTGLFGSFIWVVEQTDYNGLKGIDYREGYDENGIHCIVSLSKTFLYTFCYMVLKGSKAKSSTKGGRGGQGGQGGHRGIFQVYIRNNDKNFPIELSSVIVTAVDGIEGKPGAGGNNGKLVKDGYDVGFICKNDHKNKFYYFGGRGKKIQLTYTSLPEINDIPTCYCGYFKYVVLKNERDREKRKAYNVLMQVTETTIPEYTEYNTRKKFQKESHSITEKINKINQEEIEKEYALNQRVCHEFKASVGIKRYYLEQQEYLTALQNQKLTEHAVQLHETIYATIENEILLEDNIPIEEELEENNEMISELDIEKIQDKILNNDELTEIDIKQISNTELSTKQLEFLKSILMRSQMFSYMDQDVLTRIRRKIEFLECKTQESRLADQFNDEGRESKLYQKIEEYKESFKGLPEMIQNDGSIDQGKVNLLAFRLATSASSTKFLTNLNINSKTNILENTSIEEILTEFNPDLMSMLEKLGESFLNYKQFIRGLFVIFRCNGCHFSSRKMKFLINTILFSHYQFGTDMDCYFLKKILIHDQASYINEFFIIRIENFYRRKLKANETTELRERLAKISNNAIKILLCTKLGEADPAVFSFQFLKKFLKVLSYTNPYKALKDLNINEWRNIIRTSKWMVKVKDIERDSVLQSFHYHILKLKENFEAEHLQELKQIFLDGNRNFGQQDIAKIFFLLSSGEVSPQHENFYEFLDNIRNCQAFNRLYQNSRKFTEIIKLMKISSIDFIHELNQIYGLIMDTGICDNVDLTLNQILMGIVESRRNKIDFKNWVERAQFWISLLYNLDFENNSVYYPYLIQLIDEVIYAKLKYRLRHVQKVAVLVALRSKKSRLLMQIATGEGKSIVIAVIAIIKLFESKMSQVHIVTSSKLLAIRDASSSDVHGETLKYLYEFFGLKVGHNCYNELESRKKIYKECQVIYGNLESFQRDYLEDTFYNKNLGATQRHIVIVDEVDNMLLDKANYVFYLSRPIAGMGSLDQLFIHIWDCVNRPLAQGLTEMFETASIKKEIYNLFFGKTSKQKVRKILEYNAIETNKIWKALLEANILSNEGCLVGNLQCYEHKLREVMKDNNTIARLADHFLALKLKQKYQISNHLQTFVLTHIEKFIENAKIARKMKEKEDYVIDISREESDESGYWSQVIPIDNSTGTDLHNTQWNYGLHQFLQLKHCCRLTSLNIKAVFISNVSFFNQYPIIFGFSGTLGSKEEQKLLERLYKFEHSETKQLEDLHMAKIPTNKRKNFFEEEPIICVDKDEWIEKIFEELVRVFSTSIKKSILIIVDTIKNAEELQRKIIEIANSKPIDDGNNEIYCLLSNPANVPEPYIRDYKPFIYGDGKNLLGLKKVLIATTLSGRGTNIKLTDELIENGGLHVIVAFLPKNTRIEDQAYGRAARNGQPGSARLIFIDKNSSKKVHDDFRRKVINLKKKRDIDESSRLKLIENNYYKNIVKEEECFAYFTEKFKQKVYSYANDSEKELKISILLDAWALWLDLSFQNMVRRSNDFDKIKREIDDLLQQENKTPSLEIKSAILNLKDKPKFEDLNNAYKKLVNLDKIDSSYLPEQNYYLGFIELARCSNMDPEKKDKIHKLLGVARFLFNRKAASKTVLISLIKFYHFQTPDQFINLNSFEEQQIQQSDVYKLFSLSVENVLGRQIKPGQLVKVGIDETQAYDAIGAFKSAGIITEPKVLPINETDMLNIYKLAKKHKLVPIKLLALLKEAKVDQITPEYISANLKLPSTNEFQKIISHFKILYEADYMIELSKPSAFHKFGSITIEDLHYYGITLDEARICLEKLVKENILIRGNGCYDQNGLYFLNESMDPSKFPACYKQTLLDAFETSFAYRIAYLDGDIEGNRFLHTGEILLYDLIEYNLVRPPLVNLLKLTTENIRKALIALPSWQNFANEEAKFTSIVYSIYQILYKEAPEYEKTRTFSIRLVDLVKKVQKSTADVFDNGGLAFLIETSRPLYLSSQPWLLLDFIKNGLIFIRNMNQLPNGDINNFVAAVKKVCSNVLNIMMENKNANISEAMINLDQGNELLNIVTNPYRTILHRNNIKLEMPDGSQNEPSATNVFNLVPLRVDLLMKNYNKAEIFYDFIETLKEQVLKNIMVIFNEKVRTSDIIDILKNRYVNNGEAYIKELLNAPSSFHIQTHILTEMMKIVEKYFVQLNKALYKEFYFKDVLQVVENLKDLDFCQIYQNIQENFVKDLDKKMPLMVELFKDEIEQNEKVREKIRVENFLQNNSENNSTILHEEEQEVQGNQAENEPIINQNQEIHFILNEISIEVASFQIFEEWVSDILERSIDDAFEKQMKKFKAEIVRYLRDVIDKECSIPLMDQRIYDDSQLAKVQEKIIQTRTKRYTEVDPLKSEYCAILWDFYVKTNEKRWLAAIFQENVPLPLDRYAVDACCQTLCKTLKSLLNSFGGLKLVVYGEEVVLESKSGDDMLTELHVLSLNGYFYLAPIENMDCFRKNDNHYLSVLEALIAEFDECEIFEGNYLGFSKQMSIHALTELNYL